MRSVLVAIAATSLLAGGALAAEDAARAQPQTPPQWTVGGFGTLGAVWHQEDDTQFRRSVDQRRGARANELDFGVDSALGLQVHGVLTPQWSVTAQAVMNQGRHGEWGPHLVWGFVKYLPNDWSEIRVGRLVTDIFIDGDSRHVGYAYTTVRPYTDVYGRLTYDGFDGIDASVQRPLGDGVLRFKVFGGRTRGSVYLNQNEHPMNLGRTFGATLDWIGPELSFKLSWGRMVTTRNDTNGDLRSALGDVAAMGAALNLPQLAAQASARAGEITASNRVGYLGAALAWERGPFSLQLMGTDMSMTAFPGFEGWGAGLTAAYRFGRWKPYVTYSRSVIDPNERRLDLPLERLPDLAGLSQVWGGLHDYTRHDQYTIGAGVRYDVTENVALKLQVDRIEAKRSSSLLDDKGFVPGMAAGPAGPFVEDASARSLTLFSASLDFVF